MSGEPVTVDVDRECTRECFLKAAGGVVMSSEDLDGGARTSG